MLHGEEEMAVRIEQHYRDLLDIGQRILEFVKNDLFRTFPEEIPNDSRLHFGACLPLISMGFKIVRGINYLAVRGMDELAFVSLRPLGEAFAILGWIMAVPVEREERARQYMWAEMIETYEWTLSCIRMGVLEGIPHPIVQSPDLLLGPIREDIWHQESSIECDPKEIARRVERRMRQLVNRRRWASASPEDMFSAAETFIGGTPEDKVNFAIAWKLVSGMMHGLHPRMFAVASEDSIGPNFSADDTHVGAALFHSSVLLVGMVDAADRALNLGWQPTVKSFYDELGRHAQRRPPSLGFPI